jgi:hypothetical protein
MESFFFFTKKQFTVVKLKKKKLKFGDSFQFDWKFKVELVNLTNILF